MYPRIITDLAKLEGNLTFLAKKLKDNGLSVTAVTKVFCAVPEIMTVFNQISEIDSFGDSRVENLKSYGETEKKKVLLRIPMHSEVADVVKYADISLNSELSTITLLNQEAKKIGKVHQILLMVDLGDLREGFFYDEDLLAAVEEVIKLENIELIGLGTNLTCFGAVLPDEKNLGRLVRLAEEIRAKHNIPLPMISGGNSSSLHLLDDKDKSLPKEINNLRIGESFLLAQESAFSTKYPEMSNQVFILEAEIIEMKEKPSVPVGETGVDAFGEKPVFQDKGMRTKGIIAIGKQDIKPDALIPLDERLEVIGGSSDHTLMDFTNAPDYKVGDIVSFRLEYGALLGAFTSKYVEKVYKK